MFRSLIKTKNSCKLLTHRSLIEGARWDFSQKKTLPFSDVSLGARWDSNPRHSEPQSYSRTLGNPFVYAESQRFRFKICADFAPIFDNYCFNSLILSSNLPLSSLAKNSFVACSFSSIVSTLSICS